MLVNIGPILIAVFAGLLLGEGFPRWLVVGLAVAFAGVLLIGVATRRPGPTWSASSSAWSPRSPTPAGWWRRSRCCAGCPRCRSPSPRARWARSAACRGPARWSASSASAPARLDRRHGLPRRGADRAGLHHLGLRALPDGRRPLGATTYLVPPLVVAAGLAAARRGPAGARRGRRRGLPGRGRLSRRRARVRPPVPVPQEAGPRSEGRRRGALDVRPRGSRWGKHDGDASSARRCSREARVDGRTGRRSSRRPRGRPRSTTRSPGGSSRLRPAGRLPRPGTCTAGARPDRAAADDQLRHRRRVRRRSPSPPPGAPPRWSSCPTATPSTSPPFA